MIHHYTMNDRAPTIYLTVSNDPESSPLTWSDQASETRYLDWNQLPE